MADPTPPVAGSSPWAATLNNYLGWVEDRATIRDIVVSFSGSLTTGSSAPVVIHRPTTIKSVTLTARTASSTGNIQVDVKRVGSQTSTSVFTTGAEPILTANRTWEATEGRGVTFTTGDLLQVEITNGGSGAADLAVILTVEETPTQPWLDQLKNSGLGTSATDVVAGTGGNSDASSDQWTTLVDPGSGTLKWSTTQAPAGQSRSMEVVAPSLTNILAAWSFPNSKEVYGRVLFRTTSIPTTGEIRLVRMLESGNPKGVLNITQTNGYVQLLNSSSVQVAIGSTAVSTTNWNRIEFRFVQGSNGFAQAWLFTNHTDTTPAQSIVGTSSNGLSTTGYDEIQFGRVATSGGPFTFYLAGMAVGTRGKFGVV